MCTFADGGDPQCLNVLKPHMHWQHHFKFNNSALYADPSRGDPTVKFFWELAMNSVKHFLDFVEQTSVTPMSLLLSKKVLQTRELMRDQADGATDRIQKGIAQMEYCHKMLEDMAKNKKDLDANKDYSFTEMKSIPKMVPLGPNDTAYQWCTECNQLCCQSCRWDANQVQSPCTY